MRLGLVGATFGQSMLTALVNERRSIGLAHVQSSRRNNFLEFPPFHQAILWQSSWDAREHTGRIKVLLSEQLVRKSSSSPGELDLGPAIDIVCFAFQHAPRGKLKCAVVKTIWHSIPIYVLCLRAKTSSSRLVSPGPLETLCTYHPHLVGSEVGVPWVPKYLCHTQKLANS